MAATAKGIQSGVCCVKPRMMLAAAHITLHTEKRCPAVPQAMARNSTLISGSICLAMRLAVRRVEAVLPDALVLCDAGRVADDVPVVDDVMRLPPALRM